MPIDATDIERMLVEIMTGKEPTLRTPEADAMREQLRKECEEIKARGDQVFIPHDPTDE